MHLRQGQDNQCAQLSVKCFCKVRHEVVKIALCLFSEASELCKRMLGSGMLNDTVEA